MVKNLNKILIIEDEAFLNRVLAVTFQKSGFEVTCVENGSDAYRTAVDKLPSLIILDIALPNEDGVSILDKLKHDIKTKNIPIIILTIISDNSILESFKERGATKCLIKKNIQTLQLLEEVTTVLNLP